MMTAKKPNLPSAEILEQIAEQLATAAFHQQQLLRVVIDRAQAESRNPDQSILRAIDHHAGEIGILADRLEKMV